MSRRVAGGLFVLLAALVVGLSHQPKLPMGATLPPPWDKVVHGSVFLVLGFLAGEAFGEGRMGWRFGGILLGIWLFGAADEWHQRFVPGRCADVADWVADALGGLLGLGASWVFHRWRRPRLVPG